MHSPKQRIITIAGSLGSGKSSTANRLAALLGYTRASTGDFMRQMAYDRGISLGELQKLAENDSSIDHAIDAQTTALKDKKDIILDSRLGFHFLPDSFKVFLTLPTDIAAKRILQDALSNPNRHKETDGGFQTVEEITTAIEARRESEQKRYREIYGIENSTDSANFDLVINTGDYDLETVAQKILTAYTEWLEN